MVVAAALAPAAAARAGEPADRGASFTVWAGAAAERGVAVIGDGRPVRDTAPMFGLTGLGNLERFAIGGAVDGTPGAMGNGRLSLSGLAGYQPELEGTRVLLLAEGGRHRFSEVDDSWRPFVGVRVGMARTMPRHGPFELGLWGFARHDLGRDSLLAGIAFHAGLRIESAHPWKELAPESVY